MCLAPCCSNFEPRFGAVPAASQGKPTTKMEDDEDCYGFGALSDMFDDRRGTGDAAASTPSEPKRLNVEAMSRFWWSERRLNEFHRTTQRHTKEFHHVAVKLDGSRVDGGLGSVYIVPPSRSVDSGRVDDGGVLWIQTVTSDSDAQTRRKKEFQDITNREDALKTPKGSSKSTGTVFLSVADIESVADTMTQHTVQGIRIVLATGNEIELAFMPGPFYDSQNRNQLLQGIEQLLSGDHAQLQESKPADLASSAVAVSAPSSRVTSPVGVRTPLYSPSSTEDSVLSTPRRSDSARFVHDGDFKSLIRRYIHLDPSSEEAMALARQLHSTKNYQVGAVDANLPQFSTDSIYRKKTVDGLSRSLERMNHDWQVTEQDRLNRTQTRCTRDGNDSFQYTDARTNQPIPAASYEQRYMDYVNSVGQNENPVIRHFEPRIQVTDDAAESESVSPSHSSTASESIQLLGVDLLQSKVIDSAFLSTWKAMLHQSEELADEWKCIIRPEVLHRAHQVFLDKVSTQLLAYQQRSVQSHHRHVLEQPSLDDIRSEVSAVRSPSTGKRQRPSTGLEQEGSPPRRRRKRRQSLVGRLDMSLTDEKDEEDTNFISGELELSQTLDITCRLCFDADAVIEMHPCGHFVCRGCWNRLSRAESIVPGTDDVRQCPWDREAVTEQ